LSNQAAKVKKMAVLWRAQFLNISKDTHMLFRQIQESFFFALLALWANKLRSLLSLLGIVIGIFSIISVLSAVDSLRKSVQDSITSLGSDVIFIGKWAWEDMGPDYPWWKFLRRPNPDFADLDMVKSRSTTVGALAFRAQSAGLVKSRNEYRESISVYGISKEFNEVWSFPLGEGRYFSESEARMGMPVAVIGASIADDLFPGSRAIDHDVVFKGAKIRVIGVLKKEGKGLFGGFNDDAVFVPITFFRTLINLKNPDMFTEILVKAKPGITMEAMKDELTGIMRGSRKLKPIDENNFSLNEITILANQTNAIFGVLNIVGWLIGMFSIFIGGFGIANIMFVSVKERTQMIGIQKALGAKRHFILIQFLTEAVVLSLVGCMVGLLLVFLATLLASKLLDFPMLLSPMNALIGVSISVITGLVSGIIPAYSASRLDPVEAIRSK
jgi:putative ABC transport system permease protein